jgi:hypothetical protein
MLYLRRRGRDRFLDCGFSIALSMARCCRWMADTAALVHQPATVFAQVNIRLLGLPPIG